MEKIRLLLYCTKSKPYLFDHFKTKFFTSKKEIYANSKALSLNGNIVAECDFEVEEIVKLDKCISYFCRKTTLLKEKSCLTSGQLYSYLKDKNGYAIHIKNLNIFDEPKRLSEYNTYNRNGKVHIANIPIYTAPQNMMYAFDYYGNPFVLISIKSQWLCKILNGEKTIEIRKKVLKEMVK